MKGYFEGIIGGLCSGLLLLAIYAVGNAWLAGTDAGNWLNFAGVILGVILTITGALILEKIKEKIRHDKAVKALEQTIESWLAIAEEMQGNSSRPQVASLRQCLDAVGYAFVDLDRSKSVLWNTVHAFTFHTSTMLDQLKRLLSQDAQTEQSHAVITLLERELVQYGSLVKSEITAHKQHQ